MYVFYVTIFHDISDKKFFKSLLETYKKIPILHLHSDVTICIPEFLNKTLPVMMKILGSPDATLKQAEQYKRQYVLQSNKGILLFLVSDNSKNSFSCFRQHQKFVFLFLTIAKIHFLVSDNSKNSFSCFHQQQIFVFLFSSTANKTQKI